MKIVRNEKGLTFVELLVAAMVAVFVLTAILSAWIFAYRTWTAEERRTRLRIGLLKAMETIKKDIRRSSATYMSFYPSGGDTLQ
jgi:Tfp pilus assembly protein PilW